MHRRALVCVLVFAVVALADEPMLHVYGVVHDYSGRPIANARVSVSLKGRSFAESVTDSRGEFTADAPKGARVTATKGDQMGHAVIKSKEVVVKMQQIPL